jgi:hypothetical protein
MGYVQTVFPEGNSLSEMYRGDRRVFAAAAEMPKPNRKRLRPPFSIPV